MLTVDRETFERLCEFLFYTGVNRNVEAANHVLSLLGLQAPEQQKTSGVAGGITTSADPRPPAVPELPTEKGGDAVRPIQTSPFRSVAQKSAEPWLAGGRVGTGSPLSDCPPERKVPRDTSEDYHVTGYSGPRKRGCDE